MLYIYAPHSDHITIVQSVLLLDYYNSNSDAMCNSTWLSIAIERAQTRNAHLHDDLVAFTDMSRVMLKRL